MEVTYKGKKHQIKCDRDMPLFVPGADGECGNCIPECKQCILKNLGAEENKGWDDEGNIVYDMYITIAGDNVVI